jgi:DNA-binding GntR family transcriptional regulator
VLDRERVKKQSARRAEALMLSQSFHFFFAEIAGMPLLRNFFDSLWMRTGPMITLAYDHFFERVTIGHLRWRALGLPSCRFMA